MDGIAGPCGAEALPRLRLTSIAERSQLADGTARKAADLRESLCLPGRCQLRAEQVDLRADPPADPVGWFSRSGIFMRFRAAPSGRMTSDTEA